MSVTPDVIAAFQKAVGSVPKGQTIGLAVSGGSDSIAMMHLAAQTYDQSSLFVFSIDHGLRTDAAAELAVVADQARALGLPHDVADWAWDGKGNLQAAARDGRWAGLCGLARVRNATQIWIGHTEDDQVETALMRLARGSGVDGLRGMYPQTQKDGFTVQRPLLGLARADLRGWLTAHGIAWCDDPSNDDPRFDRVRARQMMGQLQDLGLTRKRVLQTIDHMQAAHLSLQKQAHSFAAGQIRQDAGDLLLAREVLELDQADAPRRALAAAFGWVSSHSYRPRFEQLQSAAARAREGQTTTLGGCVLMPETDGVVRLCREAAGTSPVVQSETPRDDTQGATWDKRWFLEGPIAKGLTFRALGDGITSCPDWRASGTPRMSLLASPSVWKDDALIAAPLAGLSQGWSAQIVANFQTSAFAIED